MVVSCFEVWLPYKLIEKEAEITSGLSFHVHFYKRVKDFKKKSLIIWPNFGNGLGR